MHDDIVVNVLAALGHQLRGGGCRPFTGDGSIETRPGQIRRPDVGVDYGRRDPSGFSASHPRVVVEVLSPTTRDFDTNGKLEEYKSVDSLAHILMIEPNAPEATVFARDADGIWGKSRCLGLDSQVDLPTIAARLSLAETYDGVEFPQRPRLVTSDPDV